MENVKPYSTAMKFGLIGGFLLIIVSLVFYILDQPDSKIPQYIGYAVIILAVILGIQNYRDKALGGYLQFSQGIGVGTLIGLIIGVVSGIWFVIYVNAIDTEFVSRLLETQVTEMEDRGMSDDQIEQAMGITKIFMHPGVFFAMIIIWDTILGLIISLIVSAIMKKEKSLV